MERTHIGIVPGLVVFALTASAGADQVTLYTNQSAFESALAALGGTAALLDFERLPDGTAVGPGDLGAENPLVYNLFGGTLSATFSSDTLFYEDFVSISPLHSLRDSSSPIDLAYGAPVAAVGTWALDIDGDLANAASALYRTTTLGSIVQTFDNSAGGENMNTFFGAIATNDAGTMLVPIIRGVVFDQAASTDFTYLDDVRTAVPAPGAALLLGLAMCLVRRR